MYCQPWCKHQNRLDLDGVDLKNTTPRTSPGPRSDVTYLLTQVHGANSLTVSPSRGAHPADKAARDEACVASGILRFARSDRQGVPPTSGRGSQVAREIEGRTPRDSAPLEVAQFRTFGTSDPRGAVGTPRPTTSG